MKIYRISIYELLNTPGYGPLPAVPPAVRAKATCAGRMEGPGPSPPDGWEWHWSRTFERHYLWSPTTNAVRWPPVGTESAEGTAGPAGSSSEPVDEDGEAQGLLAPASICQPDAEDSTELANDDSQAMDADSGVNEYFVDFGDLRVGFPDRKPAVTAQMHGWTYPPLIELVDRLLCFGGDAREQSGVNVIIEVSRSTRPTSASNDGRRVPADLSVSTFSSGRQLAGLLDTAAGSARSPGLHAPAIPGWTVFAL